ncbi:MAG: hypothetical protein JXR62_07060 [Bacilli bacterium]|nr:hypothetical protein [Bacilli bacterium]
MKYSTLIPFLAKEDLAELVEKIISGEVTNIKLAVLYPFLDDESLGKIVDYLIKEKRNKDLYSAMPFISKEKVNDIYDAAARGEMEGFKTEALIPFMGRSRIKEIFETLVKEAKIDDAFAEENDEDDEDEK